jgi:HD-GYP domain-containing protein (c-di-GMP phosphodiesterase class II)
MEAAGAGPPMDIFSHQDSLGALDRNLPLSRKLAFLYGLFKRRHPFLDRVAVALYDPAADEVRTYLSCGEGESPLTAYRAKLSEAKSLREVLEKGRPRVVNDTDLFAGGAARHTQAIAGAGFRASYTLPLTMNEAFYGFVFFNSKGKDVFDENALVDLDMAAHLINFLIHIEISTIQTLSATVKSALKLTRERDPETGTHLARMARYSRLIAQELAPRHKLDDAFVEHVFLFSPLHDLGKIGIPDSILRKPGKLTEEEFAVMKTHTEKGKALIDDLLKNFGLDGIGYVEMLRNIALHHHETVDGKGYPRGLSSESIPIEARIVAVADVFDALTSERVYKKAWTNDAAFQRLKEMAGVKLDGECVEALLKSRQDVEFIQRTFQENTAG